VWHEGEGGLEAHEFASLICDYLETISSDVEVVTMWSDGCTYQNRNSIISSALLQFIDSGKKPNLREINQKYLCRGHTQMECDSVHASIESKARRIDIYTPMEWETVMKTARVQKPFKVITVKHTFWKTFTPILNSIRPGRKAGEATVTDLRHILYCQNGEMYYSLSHGTPVRPLLIRRNLRLNSDPVQRYDGPISVAQKLPELLQLCSMIVPEDRHAFYTELK